MADLEEGHKMTDAGEGHKMADLEEGHKMADLGEGHKMADASEIQTFFFVERLLSVNMIAECGGGGHFKSFIKNLAPHM